MRAWVGNFFSPRIITWKGADSSRKIEKSIWAMDLWKSRHERYGQGMENGKTVFHPLPTAFIIASTFPQAPQPLLLAFLFFEPQKETTFLFDILTDDPCLTASSCHPVPQMTHSYPRRAKYSNRFFPPSCPAKGPLKSAKSLHNEEKDTC